MRYFVTIGPRTLEVDLSGSTPTVDGGEMHAHLAAVPGTPVRHLLVDGRSYTLLATPGARRGRWQIVVGQTRFAVDAVDERTRAILEMTGGGVEDTEKVVAAPMPGLVVKVLVAPGETVHAGQGVVVVEAMKMENELKAPGGGVVSRVEVQPGQAVEKGQTLLALE